MRTSRSYSGGFRALGSTENVNVREHTETRDTDTSVPIYYLNGEKVADDYADLYDGTGWDSDVPFDENGRRDRRVLISLIRLTIRPQVSGPERT